MNLSFAAKIRQIRLKEAWEEAYTKSLQDDVLRELSLTALGELVTPQFLEEEIVPNYSRKHREGEYARECRFPVPPEDEIVENPDGSVSFEQDLRIIWSKSDPQEFKVVHTYHFDEGGLIAAETGPPGFELRRKDTGAP